MEEGFKGPYLGGGGKMAKTAEAFVASQQKGTFFFTKCSPDMVEQALTEHLAEAEVEPSALSETKYKVVFELENKEESQIDAEGSPEGEDAQQQDQETVRTVGMCMRIF